MLGLALGLELVVALVRFLVATWFLVTDILKAFAPSVSESRVNRARVFIGSNAIAGGLAVLGVLVPSLLLVLLMGKTMLGITPPLVVASSRLGVLKVITIVLLFFCRALFFFLLRYSALSKLVCCDRKNCRHWAGVSDCRLRPNCP
jgi:hypothetical protein